MVAYFFGPHCMQLIQAIYLTFLKTSQVTANFLYDYWTLFQISLTKKQECLRTTSSPQHSIGASYS